MSTFAWIFACFWSFFAGAWVASYGARIRHAKETSDLCAYADEELIKKDKLLEELYIEYKHLAYRFKDVTENGSQEG